MLNQNIKVKKVKKKYTHRCTKFKHRGMTILFFSFFSMSFVVFRGRISRSSDWPEVSTRHRVTLYSGTPNLYFPNVESQACATDPEASCVKSIKHSSQFLLPNILELLTFIKTDKSFRLVRCSKTMCVQHGGKAAIPSTSHWRGAHYSTRSWSFRCSHLAVGGRSSDQVTKISSDCF